MKDRPDHPPPAGFVECFQEHAAFVGRVLRRQGVPERDLEDAGQEVFLVVYRRLGDFEGRSSLSTWIYGICVRVASRFRRRAHHRRELLDADDGVARDGRSQAPEQQRRIERAQALQALDRALATLSDAQRTVFILYEIEEQTLAQIAEGSGCAVSTVASRLYAARRALEVQLACEWRGEGAA